MRAHHLLVLALLSLACGCRHGLITKRMQESKCPTDIRQKHCWCWGEDAVFDTPCGTDEAYHGHKPTCWRPWPAPASVWRDERCGGPPADFSVPTHVAPSVYPNTADVIPPSTELQNPPPKRREYIAPEAPTPAPEEIPGTPPNGEIPPEANELQAPGLTKYRHSLLFSPPEKKKLGPALASGGV